MEGQLVYVKVEPRTIFTFARGLSYIAPSVSFTHVNFKFVHTEKSRDSGNQPLIFCTKKAWVHGRERTQLDAILDLLS